MMRYQRVSPDILPLANGRKPISRTWKEDADADHSSRSTSHSASDGKSIRARSAPGSAGPSPTRDHLFPRLSFPTDSPPSATHSDTQPLPTVVPTTQGRHPEIINGVGDEVLPQWGHNKRSRKPRSESRASGDESSAHSRQMLKVQRRSTAAAAAAAAAMPPPPCAGSYSRGSNPRTTSMPIRDAKKNVEEPSNGPPRSDKRSPSSSPDKPSADVPINAPAPKQPAEAAVLAIGEKLSLDRFEWPKIYVSLSRKEKEDDFLAIKGTKLPQRPKKRAKNVDKILQYCFPGMWLSDLTKGRYEVREKKCVKKRRRGLKGMESMDSDSE